MSRPSQPWLPRPLARLVAIAALILALGSGLGARDASATPLPVQIDRGDIVVRAAAGLERDAERLADRAARVLPSIALDLLAWTMLAYATGGASSPLSTLFGLSTLTAALVLGGSATLWTAVCSLGLYGVLALAPAERRPEHLFERRPERDQRERPR
jgi:hypothetical protein